MEGPGIASDDDAIRQAIEWELRLLDPAVRANEALLTATISPDFFEIGQSGRRWNRAEIVAALIADPGGSTHASEITGRALAEGLVLVEYVTTEPEHSVRRTSLWARSSGDWQILFHQGTRVQTP
jgi:hypothetical protein